MKSPTAQDTFRPIPGLISCTGACMVYVSPASWKAIASYLAEVSDYILYSISYVTRPQHPISSMLVYIRIYIYIYIYIGTSLKSTPEIRTPCFIRTIPSCPNWRGSTKYVAISKCNFLSAYQHIRHPTCCYRNMNILSN